MWVVSMSPSITTGHPNVQARSNTSCVFVMPLHFFGSKSTTSRSGEHFRDGDYSLVSSLFAVLLITVPHTYGVGAGGPKQTTYALLCTFSSMNLKFLQLSYCNFYFSNSANFARSINQTWRQQNAAW